MKKIPNSSKIIKKFIEKFTYYHFYIFLKKLFIVKYKKINIHKNI